MIKEIYTRNESDKYYSDIVEHNSDIESILSQIKIILSTRKGQVLGNYNFGCGIEDLIFTTKFNKDRIRSIITEQINENIKEFNNYSIDVDVSFFKQPNGLDAGVIDIYINKTKIQGFLVQ